MRTLIQGGWIVAYQDGHHAILDGGVLVFEDDHILHVGPIFDGAVDRVIDATGMLVTPGFVNIHALANIDIQTLVLDAGEHGFASSRADAVDGPTRLELTGEHLLASARFSLAQLLKGGSTTIVEITTMAPSQFETPRAEAPTLADTAGELGARLYVSHKFRAGKRYLEKGGASDYHWDEDAAFAGLAYGGEIVRRYEGAYDDRIRTMIFPYQFDACTPAILRAAKEAAIELNVPLHMHTAQTLFEFHDCLRRYGMTPVQLLDSIDFLDDQTILTHMLYTTAHPQSGFPKDDVSDLKVVADSGATVAHCPVVYARRDRILDSFSRYRSHGINVALGTDTFPQDMITEMRWAGLGDKWQTRDANAGAARDIFNAATVDGAKALGRDDIGRLAPGAKADIVLIDFSGLHIGPVDDPIKTLVYAANGSDIRTVIVDGRVVVKDGALPDLGESALIMQATEAHLWQKTQFTAHNPTGWPTEILFPTAYPVV